ncbi:MAG: glycoside hydrolase family 25 protein [Chloroflexi bacterium]|nr:glycoside hydrolase family 25 protein [Chloroflexota bacterium]
MIDGIDVSYWQGEISWSPVASVSKRFVVIRGGDGRFRDPRRVEYARAASQAGLIVNTYHFLRWQVSAAEMADICRESYEKIQAPTRQKGRLWLDAEDTDAGPKSLALLKDVIAKLGDIPLGIYTGAWWWNPTMPADHGLGDLPLWFAHYPRNNTVHSDPTESGIAPILPNGWDKWAIWQYSSTGIVPGIGPSVDLNVAQDGIFEGKEGEDNMAGFTDEDRKLLEKVNQNVGAVLSDTTKFRQQLLPGMAPGSFIRINNPGGDRHGQVWLLLFAHAEDTVDTRRVVGDSREWDIYGGVSAQNISWVEWESIEVAFKEGHPLPPIASQ